MALPKAPILFTKPRTALIGPYPAAINVPKCAQDDTSDYEAELCLIIGKSGRDIPEEEALDYVLGYTASNDVSARNLQMLTTQWSFSKGLDGSCPIGMSKPLSISPDAFTNPSSSRRARSGRPICDQGSSDIVYQGNPQRRYSPGWPYQGHDLFHPKTDLLSVSGYYSGSGYHVLDGNAGRYWLLPPAQSGSEGWRRDLDPDRPDWDFDQQSSL